MNTIIQRVGSKGLMRLLRLAIVIIVLLIAVNILMLKAIRTNKLEISQELDQAVLEIVTTITNKDIELIK